MRNPNKSNFSGDFYIAKMGGWIPIPMNFGIIYSLVKKMITIMKYDEAVKHKKEALEKAHDSVLRNYHIIITPADTNESRKYIDAFSKNPEAFSDDSCKQFSSNDDYEVVSFRKEESDSDQ
ncbi:hypothetical protein [Chryseobacterium gossypii]|uniref:hypothetical protein n=1 Tax=Chryseobacterium gossypii TaxID=3231602 RepID=UPI0035235872